MTQYISRPVAPTLCEAVRFDTSEQTSDFAFAEIEAFLGEERTQRVTPLGTEGFSVYHEGIKSWLEVKPGQYVLLTQPSGFAYPVDAGLFESTYQPLEEVQKDGEQTASFDVEVNTETGKATIKQVETEEPAPKAKAPRKRKTVAERAAEQKADAE